MNNTNNTNLNRNLNTTPNSKTEIIDFKMNKTSRAFNVKWNLIIPIKITEYIQEYIKAIGSTIDSSQEVKTLLLLMRLRAELYRVSFPLV